VAAAEEISEKAKNARVRASHRAFDFSEFASFGKWQIAIFENGLLVWKNGNLHFRAEMFIFENGSLV
jgi:hypothetical protein